MHHNNHHIEEVCVLKPSLFSKKKSYIFYKKSLNQDLAGPRGGSFGSLYPSSFLSPFIHLCLPSPVLCFVGFYFCVFILPDRIRESTGQDFSTTSSYHVSHWEKAQPPISTSIKDGADRNSDYLERAGRSFRFHWGVATRHREASCQCHARLF